MVFRTFSPAFGAASLVLLTIVFIAGCGTQAGPPSDIDAPTALPVEVARVERGTATARLTSTASLEAENEATVVARVGGVVQEVLVEEGQYVRADQPLARLDDERLALELRRADVAMQELKTAFERAQTMYDKQLVSREFFEQAKAQYESQQVAADLAQLELAYATIRAPIAGWVSLRYLKPGNVVAANDPAFEITNLNRLRAVLHVPERELAKLAVDQPATLRFDALPDRVFEGRVALIGPVVDPSTGTFRTTVEVRDPTRTIKPGMFGRIEVEYDRRDSTLLAPKAALVEEDDAVTVFVVRDSLALRQTVKTGYSETDQIEILEGLSEGDQVALSGQTALRDSARVEIIQ
jgi:membrane fusion protein (multidrug efflux system)